MSKNRQILKYFLWTVIVVSLGVLLFSTYIGLKRINAEKRIEEFSAKMEKPISKSEKPIEEDPIDDKVYSIDSNPQKQWLDINSDYQGWLSIEGTNIDYPVVRAVDNFYYLDRDFLKEKSELGAIFMDYRNVGNFNDRHSAIYGHFTWNGKMFADLHKYKEEDFAKQNSIITLNTLYGEKQFQIFSVYVDSAKDYRLKFQFLDDREYEDYLKDLQNMSIYDLSFDWDPDKLLITLATCSYEVGDGRLIVHGIEK